MTSRAILSKVLRYPRDSTLPLLKVTFAVTRQNKIVPLNAMETWVDPLYGQKIPLYSKAFRQTQVPIEPPT